MVAKSILENEYLSLGEAARLVPPNGCHPQTVIRWARCKCKPKCECNCIRTGKPILKTVKIAQRRWTTKKWLEEFLSAVQSLPTEVPAESLPKQGHELDELLDGKPKRKSAKSARRKRSRKATG